MRIFRRLELISALAGALVGVLGVIFILYATTANYTYGSGTGNTVHGVHGTIPAIQDPHLAPALIRIAVVEMVLLGLMLLGAVMHVRTRHVGWGLTEGVRRKPRRFNGSGEADLLGFSQKPGGIDGLSPIRQTT